MIRVTYFIMSCTDISPHRSSAPSSRLIRRQDSSERLKKANCLNVPNTVDHNEDTYRNTSENDKDNHGSSNNKKNKTQIETENKNINKNGSETKEERKEQDDDWSPSDFLCGNIPKGTKIKKWFHVHLKPAVSGSSIIKSKKQWFVGELMTYSYFYDQYYYYHCDYCSYYHLYDYCY